MINYSIHLLHFKKSFQSALESLKNIEKKSLIELKKIKVLENSLKSNIIVPKIGKVYSFIYDAMGKKELSYYDRYPLVLITSINRRLGVFHGLNFHYLNTKLRTYFIQYLMDKKYNFNIDRITSNNLHKVLFGIPKRMYKVCIKQYRFANVLRLEFKEISPLILNEINNINDNTFMYKATKDVHIISRKRVLNKF